MERQKNGGWQIVESEIVIETPHLRLRRDSIELPDGNRIGDYYVRESRGFCVVFALTTSDHVVLVRQYKHGIGQTLLELPAGGIDGGETPAECARRELAEETGYVAEAGGLEHVGTFIFDPTSSTTRYHVFVARNARKAVATKFDATEDIAVELATIEDVRRFCRDGTIHVGVHVGSIYYVLDRLGRL
ncbi:MAG: NUDIX hydrolase [Candidatus Eremiobacteraeota bacterium]|nr:NUDIX hydrolase [Candidatus Eremiobacteraeota bacterium]